MSNLHTDDTFMWENMLVSEMGSVAESLKMNPYNYVVFSLAPEWASYWAMDDDGDAWWFELEPAFNGVLWGNEDGEISSAPDFGFDRIHCRNSLVKLLAPKSVPCKSETVKSESGVSDYVDWSQAPEWANYWHLSLQERPEADTLGTGKVKSDGGSTGYYEVPDHATELRHLISHKGMSKSRGDIFKACYRLGEKEGADVLYDLNKMEFFIQDLKEMYNRGEHL